MAKTFHYHHKVFTDKSLHSLGHQIERHMNEHHCCDDKVCEYIYIEKVNGLYVALIIGKDEEDAESPIP